LSDKRGLYFLVGMAVLWFLYRLHRAGIIFAAIAYTTGIGVCSLYGEPVYADGPGAIIVAFLIESVITIGWVATLSLSGIWDALVVAGRFIGDGFGTAHAAIKASQGTPGDALAPAAVVAVVPEMAVSPPSTKTEEQQAIEMLSSQLVALAAQIEADKAPAKKVVK